MPSDRLFNRNQGTTEIQIKQIPEIASLENGRPEQRAALFERRGFLSPVLARDLKTHTHTSQIHRRPAPLGMEAEGVCAFVSFSLVKPAFFFFPSLSRDHQPTGWAANLAAPTFFLFRLTRSSQASRAVKKKLYRGTRSSFFGLILSPCHCTIPDEGRMGNMAVLGLVVGRNALNRIV